jgi:hypothetical protein
VSLSRASIRTPLSSWLARVARMSQRVARSAPDDKLRDIRGQVRVRKTPHVAFAHAGYLLRSRAADSVSDCFSCRPFQSSHPSPISPDGDANATFGASCCAHYRIVLPCRVVQWRRDGSNGAHRLCAGKTQQGGPAQAGQAGVHKAGAGPAYRQTEPGGFRSPVHGGPPGRTKNGEVSPPTLLAEQRSPDERSDIRAQVVVVRKAPHVAEFTVRRASRDPLAHAGYMLAATATVPIRDLGPK